MNGEHRLKIVSEIIETEKSYLNQLDKLQNFFSKPSLERGLLPSHAHSAIFSQLSAIYQMNSKLLEEIINERNNVGIAFLKFGPFLKVYSSYANNFRRSLEILQKWEADSEAFKSFVSVTESRPEVQTKLISLLITPVQRIPRYRLLLEELLKCIDPSDQSYSDVRGALNQISDVAKHIDQSVDATQSFSRLLLVQRALKDQQPSIIIPGRKILKEGVLNKVSRKGHGSQARLFFLFSDMIMYTKLPAQSISTNSKETQIVHTDELKPNSLECCCMLPLRYCRVTTVFGSSDQGITFRLQCSDEDLLLYSANSSDGENWIRDIKETAKEAIRKRKTLRKASSRKKAVRKTPLRKMRVSDEEPSAMKSKEDSIFPFELGTLKAHFRNARECLTPTKSAHTTPNQNKNPIDDTMSILATKQYTSSFKNTTTTIRSSPRTLSPLATCSWGNGQNSCNKKAPFLFQNSVRGREGSQLTPSPLRGKKRPISELFSPRKKPTPTPT